MSNELVCPFCQQELDTGNYYVHCHNPHCDITEEMEGTEEMWEALIRTCKALEIAVSQLKKTSDYIEDCRYQETNYFLVDSKDVSIILDETNDALEQITTLKQKDVK